MVVVPCIESICYRKAFRGDGSQCRSEHLQASEEGRADASFETGRLAEDFTLRVSVAVSMVYAIQSVILP